MKSKIKKVVGIPARMGSTRFPGKPLCKLMGKSMIYHCYKRSALSKLVDEVFVATCDKQIADEVKSFGGNIIMTKKNIKRPGLRVAEAARKLSLKRNDIVVVVQGDEPIVRPEMIDISIKELIKNKNTYVVNLCSKISSSDIMQTGEIKVVCDNQMYALYMSRSSIPSNAHQEVRTDFYKQVCVMPFRWHFMNYFNFKMKPTNLELQESIEMLRIIQNGYKIKMVLTNYINKSVDSEEDRIEAEKLLQNDSIQGY